MTNGPDRLRILLIMAQDDGVQLLSPCGGGWDPENRAAVVGMSRAS
jgi:hypothetical protein